MQTEPETRDCAVQCCLIPAPPLKPIPVDESSCASDTEGDTETEVDTDSSSYIPYEETTHMEKLVKFTPHEHVNNSYYLYIGKEYLSPYNSKGSISSLRML